MGNGLNVGFSFVHASHALRTRKWWTAEHIDQVKGNVTLRKMTIIYAGYSYNLFFHLDLSKCLSCHCQLSIASKHISNPLSETGKFSITNYFLTMFLKSIKFKFDLKENSLRNAAALGKSMNLPLDVFGCDKYRTVPYILFQIQHP